MIIASIDIGSNTIILLVAQYNETDSKLFTIINEYSTPRISRGLDIDKVITPDSINRLIDGLDHFREIIAKYNPELVLINATNAMRVAKNAESVKKLIKEKFGWNVNIITGEREAELTFLGIALPSPSKDENILLIDIGGGSTEVSYGDLSKVVFKKSFSVGIVSLFERFVHSDPPTSEELLEIRAEISKTFYSLAEIIPANQIAIAVAGTPTTLASIMMNVSDYEDQLVENSLLHKEYLTEFIQSIKMLNSTQIKLKYGSLVKGREDLILVGTIILEELMKVMRVEVIKVSAKGLRYGAIWDYLIVNKMFSITAKNENP